MVGPIWVQSALASITIQERVEVGKEEKRRGVPMPVLADNMGSTSCRLAVVGSG